jgi:transglutaminase-like putative cysteine protease
MTASGQQLCEPTEFLDYESPPVRDFLAAAVPDPGRPARELAVDLYYAVRDGIQYEIYGADLSRRGLTAGGVVERGRGLCIHKSVLYAACARALGIPSRLILVDVRNHVASPRLMRLLGGDVFTYHCLTRLRLDGRWVKATPVFSETLCRLYRMTPLDFDGRTDAVFQPYDDEGRSVMEIVHEHGEFDDLPYERVVEGMRSAHRGIFDGSTRIRRGSLVTEAKGA